MDSSAVVSAAAAVKRRQHVAKLLVTASMQENDGEFIGCPIERRANTCCRQLYSNDWRETSLDYMQVRMLVSLPIWNQDADARWGHLADTQPAFKDDLKYCNALTNGCLSAYAQPPVALLAPPRLHPLAGDAVPTSPRPTLGAPKVSITRRRIWVCIWGIRYSNFY